MTDDLAALKVDKKQHQAAETAAWYWLAYRSGLPLKRTKALLRTLSENQTSLRALLDTKADLQALSFTAPETELLRQNTPDWPRLDALLQEWQAAGVILIRRDQPQYPYTLRTHLHPSAQPLFLSYKGEPGLWEMPLIKAMVGDSPDPEVSDWTLRTLQMLAFEGALPLLVARSGFAAALARQFLQEQIPFALVIPQGLALYTPPPALQSALAAGRVLLISPFPPDKPAPQPNSLLPATLRFAQTLAHALLIITLPFPGDLFPEQPCFLRPGLAKTIGCQHEFIDAEDLFLQLNEIPRIAAPYLTPDPTPAPTPPDPALLPTDPPPPPPDPEELIQQLSQLGHVPDILKQRLRRNPGANTSDS